MVRGLISVDRLLGQTDVDLIGFHDGTDARHKRITEPAGGASRIIRKASSSPYHAAAVGEGDSVMSISGTAEPPSIGGSSSIGLALSPSMLAAAAAAASSTEGAEDEEDEEVTDETPFLKEQRRRDRRRPVIHLWVVRHARNWWEGRVDRTVFEALTPFVTSSPYTPHGRVAPDVSAVTMESDEWGAPGG